MAEPKREEVDQMPGPVVLEFGATWCPHCQGIQSTMDSMLKKYPDVRHIFVEDGKGLPLGRSFSVKLWPTLVFMREGQIKNQISRPSPDEIARSFADLAKG
jgi:thioredoxin 1